jgi:hypothetical protein
MKKILHIIAKVVLSLILILPVAGATGMLGEATRDLYNTDLAFAFYHHVYFLHHGSCAYCCPHRAMD